MYKIDGNNHLLKIEHGKGLVQDSLVEGQSEALINVLVMKESQSNYSSHKLKVGKMVRVDVGGGVYL